MNPVHLLLVAAGVSFVAAGFLVYVPLGMLALSLVLAATWYGLGDQ